MKRNKNTGTPEAQTPGCVDNKCPAVSGEIPENSPAAAINCPEKDRDARRRKSRVMVYLLLLFAFAFLLLLLSYVLSQRSNQDAVTSLTEAQRVLSENSSQAIALLQRENDQLREDRDALSQQAAELTGQLALVEERLAVRDGEKAALVEQRATLQAQLEALTSRSEMQDTLRELICRGLQAMLDEDLPTVVALRDQLAALDANDNRALLTESFLGAEHYAAYRLLAGYEQVLPEQDPDA